MIPNCLRKLVLEELHEGHAGMSGMNAIARSFIWWPGIDREVKEVVKACVTCQNRRSRPSVTPPHPWTYPESPWQRVHADFAEYKGRQYLIMVDAYSKWPEVHEMGTQATAGQTIEAMRKSFTYHGLPQRLVTDNGPQFKAYEFQDFMRSNGIKHQKSPPYHPATNG